VDTERSGSKLPPEVSSHWPEARNTWAAKTLPLAPVVAPANKNQKDSMRLSFPSVFAGLIALGVVTGPALADSTTDKTEMNDNGAAVSQPGGKTSDRTPGTESPDRGTGAGTTGAAGTDAAKTPEGTSTRTDRRL
jgi:hypothetical protein